MSSSYAALLLFQIHKKVLLLKFCFVTHWTIIRRLKPLTDNQEVNGDVPSLMARSCLHNMMRLVKKMVYSKFLVLLMWEVWFSLLDVGNESACNSPFEFLALEVALEAICSFLSARTIELESAISNRNLDRVRKLKSQMTRLTARVQKVRDELEQLLDDDDDMADLYLSRKLAGASPVSDSGAASWFLASPTIGSKISKASRASIATMRGDENDVEELEMLLEIIC
ncbi:hypothetical protein SASPL_116629 [Salvia splendens]|uniref:Magnesium transporter n=1 Tax=Salvia splendens TaxID=180675 RepID=A0A8X8XTJ6_SALSN|nr:hypothetical protein SASPL_116629 [Salvia splendens]